MEDLVAGIDALTPDLVDPEIHQNPTLAVNRSIKTVDSIIVPREGVEAELGSEYYQRCSDGESFVELGAAEVRSQREDLGHIR